MFFFISALFHFVLEDAFPFLEFGVMKFCVMKFDLM